MQNSQPARWPRLLTIGFSSFVLLCILLGLVFGLVSGCTLDYSKLEQQKLSSIIYGANDKVVTVLYEENRDYITLDQVPQYIKDAFIAAEDRKFYEHRGVDPKGIVRALLTNIRSGGIEGGASTLTQQLARQTFLSNEQTITRKIREAFIAMSIERNYTKDQIFEMYLNKIFFGKRAFGIQAASRAYLGKDVRDLTLSEAALIAGLVNAPSVYMNNPERAMHRRDIVLDDMAEFGIISTSQAEQAKKVPVKYTEQSGSSRVAPYFMDYIVQELARHGISESQIYTGGLKIKTTLDPDMQKAAEKAFAEGLPPGAPDAQGVLQPQAALVALDPHTGYIKAMIGGRDFGNTQLNRAVNAHRQTGSTIKPFVYTAALDNQFTPASIVVDEPIDMPKGDGGRWKPQNYDKKYRGPIALREALELSVNSVAIKLADQVGVQTVMRYAQRMGLSSLVTTGPVNDLNLSSLALGGLSKGVTPLELASAYTPLANRGIRVEPIAILEVRDPSGTVLYRNHTKKSVVLSESTAYVMTDMMRGVVERGTGRAAGIGRPAAGKTGTSNDNTNAWFVGYTPELLAAVWLGNDVQKKALPVGSGVTARIWGRFVSQALANVPVSDFPVPQDVATNIEICAESGYRAGPYCPATRMETFVVGTEPTDECPLHGADGSSRYEAVRICSLTGKQATSGCPDDHIITKYYDRVSGREIHDTTTRPWTYCDMHASQEVSVKVCTESGLLATSYCPADSVIMQTFIEGEQPTEPCDVHEPGRP